MAKPTDKLNWVPDNDPAKVVQPSTGKKNIGWQAEEKPPFQWFNWTLNVISRWFNYYETTTDALITTTDTLNNTTSTQGSAIAALGTALGTTNTNVSALDDRLDVVEGDLTDRVDEVNGFATALQIQDFLNFVDLIGAVAGPSSGKTKVFTKGGQLYLRASGGAEILVSSALQPQIANITGGVLTANIRYLFDTLSLGALAYSLPTGAAGSKFMFLDAMANFENANVTITPATGQKFAGLAINVPIVLNVTRGFSYLEWDVTNSAWIYYGNAASELGGGGGGGLAPEPKSAAFTAVKGKRYLLDLSAPIAIQMPQGASGVQLAFFDSLGKAEQLVNFASLTPYTGQKFQGMANNEVLKLDGKFQRIEAYWDTVNTQWAWDTNTIAQVQPAGAATRGTISGEQIYTFTTTMFGPFATFPVDILISKIGRLVTLNFPDTRKAGNSTAAQVSFGANLPTEFRPIADSTRFAIGIVNANSQQAAAGCFVVDANGAFALCATFALGSFSASTGTNGAYPFAVSYLAAP